MSSSVMVARTRMIHTFSKSFQFPRAPREDYLGVVEDFERAAIGDLELGVAIRAGNDDLLLPDGGPLEKRSCRRVARSWRTPARSGTALLHWHPAHATGQDTRLPPLPPAACEQSA